MPSILRPPVGRRRHRPALVPGGRSPVNRSRPQKSSGRRPRIASPARAAAKLRPLDRAATTRLTGWGLNLRSDCVLREPELPAEVASWLDHAGTIPRGLGRSYGDAALNMAGRCSAAAAGPLPRLRRRCGRADLRGGPHARADHQRLRATRLLPHDHGSVPIWIGISGAVTPYDGWTWVQPQWVWNGKQWVWQDGYWAPVR